MKPTAFLIVCALFTGLSLSAQSPQGKSFRQTYPIPQETEKINAAKIANDMESKPNAWKNAPFVYYTVPAISPVKRLSDTYPADGKLLGQLEYVAAKGTYEPSSIQVYPFRNVDKFEMKASDLKNASGSVIPASALDIKMVKIWYQGGSAWFGYFNDSMHRVLCPELLLYDEDLIRVDTATQDNYVRYNCPDGSTLYEWMSFLPTMNNYKTGGAKYHLMSDAKTFLGTVLNKSEFKQYFITLAVPEKAESGVYTGSIELIADGRSAGNLPVKVRVLPFELPLPGTNWDPAKRFYASIYASGTDKREILLNLKRHNIIYPMLPRLSYFDEAVYTNQINLLKECGMPTRPLFGMAPRANTTIAGDVPNAAEQAKLDNHREEIRKITSLLKKLVGHTEVYSYGIDEAGPDIVRREQEAWKINHQEGAGMMVTSGDNRRLFYALDYWIYPGAPAPGRQKDVELFREAHPDKGMVAWYANPHTSPEDPDYTRRIYGLLPYKLNYTNISNHTWYRNNWNDFACDYEPELRGLMMVYPVKDNVLDTLQWEGLREGVDDIRYVTKLKLLANEALASKNADVKLLARKALGIVAYFDARRDDPALLRLESIDYILKLESAMKGAK